MDAHTLGDKAVEALLLALTVSLPVLAVAAIVGVLVAALQASAQVQDPTLSHLPRLIGVVAALAILGPWIAHQITSFAERMFSAGAH
jgi:type III secretion HrpO family protein